MSQLDLNVLKRKRLEKGYSMQYMAEALGFKTAASYLNYERGTSELRADMLPVLAKTLGCSIETFYT